MAKYQPPFSVTNEHIEWVSNSGVKNFFTPKESPVKTPSRKNIMKKQLMLIVAVELISLYDPAFRPVVYFVNSQVLL